MRMVELIQHDFVSGRLQAEVWEITREAWLHSAVCAHFRFRRRRISLPRLEFTRRKHGWR